MAFKARPNVWWHVIGAVAVLLLCIARRSIASKQAFNHQSISSNHFIISKCRSRNQYDQPARRSLSFIALSARGVIGACCLRGIESEGLWYQRKVSFCTEKYFNRSDWGALRAQVSLGDGGRPVFLIAHLDIVVLFIDLSGKNMGR